MEHMEINIQSRKEAMDLPVPSSVFGDQNIHGRNPQGWPHSGGLE